MNVGFHSSISYQCYDDFAVLLDRHRIARLNASAGRLLENIDRGWEPKTKDEKAFVQALEKAGFLRDSEERLSKASSQTGLWDESGVYDELNRWASRNLVPLHVHLELTWRCPLRCRHCYLEGLERRPKEELTLLEIERFLLEARNLGALFLTLSGGEPFMRDDFEQIVEMARGLRFSVALLTSGFRTQKKTLEHFAALGLDGLQVSLYGADAALHDDFTQRDGAFEKAWKTLTTAKELGMSVRAAVAVTRWNLHGIGALVQKLNDAEIPWNPVMNLFPRRVDGLLPENLQLDQSQLREVLKLLPERKRFRMSELRLDDPPCNAGRSMVAVGPYGDVFPCATWPQQVGNLRETSFEELWKNAPVLRELRKWTLADLKDCPDCSYRSTCNRCPGFAMLTGYGFNDHSPLDCFQAKEYGEIK